MSLNFPVEVLLTTWLFRAAGSKDLIDRLKILKVPYRERMVEEMNLFQLFVEDPNNITLELNYWDD